MSDENKKPIYIEEQIKQIDEKLKTAVKEFQEAANNFEQVGKYLFEYQKKVDEMDKNPKVPDMVMETLSKISENQFALKEILSFQAKIQLGQETDRLNQLRQKAEEIKVFMPFRKTEQKVAQLYRVINEITSQVNIVNMLSMMNSQISHFQMVKVEKVVETPLDAKVPEKETAQPETEIVYHELVNAIVEEAINQPPPDMSGINVGKLEEKTEAQPIDKNKTTYDNFSVE